MAHYLSVEALQKVEDSLGLSVHSWSMTDTEVQSIHSECYTRMDAAPGVLLAYTVVSEG